MSQKKIRKLKKLDLDNVSREPEIRLGSWMGAGDIIKENWLVLVMILIGVVAVYVNSLQGAFVSDDYATILNNPTVASIAPNLVTLNIVPLINSVIATIFGVQSPTPFHLFSLLLYLSVLVLAFIWLRMWFDRGVTMATTTLFAFLPIHVENVSWVSGKPYMLIAFFSLITLITFSLYVKSGYKKYLYMFFVSLPWPFLVERARGFTMLFALVLFVIVFYKEFRVKINWGKFVLVGLLGVLVVTAIMWPLMMDRIASVNSGYNSSESIFYNPFFQYPTAVAKYLQLIVAPTDLTLYHTMFVFPAWLNWFVLVLYLAAIGVFWFKNKKIFFAMAFVFVTTLPSMAPVKVSWLVAERYIFFGSLGMCLAIVLVLEPILAKYKYVSLGILTVTIALYSSRIFLRNIDWQTNHNLWVNTCQVSPNSHNAWNNIGDDYDKLKDYPDAIKGFTQSTVVKPNYADAYHNRANIFFKMGRTDLARDSYETALKYSPGLFQTYLSLTQIDLMERKGDLAIQDATQATKVQPNNPQAWYVLGVVQSQLGRNDLALASMKQSLSVDPTYKPANDAFAQLSLGLTKK